VVIPFLQTILQIKDECPKAPDSTIKTKRANAEPSPAELDSMIRGASAGRELAFRLGVPLALCLRLPGVAWRIRDQGGPDFANKEKAKPGSLPAGEGAEEPVAPEHDAEVGAQKLPRKFFPPGKVRQAKFMRMFCTCASAPVWDKVFG
jgi:hypothetical protein